MGNLCRYKNIHVLFYTSHPGFFYRIYRVQWCSLVLRTFLMTTATCPFSIELSSLTMRIRQEQSTSRERASRIRPTAISDRFTSTKRCVPGNTQKHAHNYKKEIHNVDKTTGLHVLTCLWIQVFHSASLPQECKNVYRSTIINICKRMGPLNLSKVLQCNATSQFVTFFFPTIKSK